MAALEPGRVAGLVSVGGYNMHNLARSGEPATPGMGAQLLVPVLLPLGARPPRAGTNRNELCELLWRTWSPAWGWRTPAFPASAPSLHNPDFVDVVIHSYRHRYELADGDPRYQPLEDLIAQEPRITVPTVVLESGETASAAPRRRPAGTISPAPTARPSFPALDTTFRRRTRRRSHRPC